VIEPSVLGEIVSGKEFYDYADKYIDDGAQLLAPAEVEEGLSRELRAVAVQAFRAIGGWGMARVDFLVEGERYWVNEINTLPGFTDISMYPRLWGLTGVPLPALVDRLVQIAIERHQQQARLDGGIKAWIATLAK
jgi:D-alanine-D-alanine ligase